MPSGWRYFVHQSGSTSWVFSFLQLQGVQLTSPIRTICTTSKLVVKAENCCCTAMLLCVNPRSETKPIIGISNKSKTRKFWCNNPFMWTKHGNMPGICLYFVYPKLRGKIWKWIISPNFYDKPTVGVHQQTKWGHLFSLKRGGIGFWMWKPRFVYLQFWCQDHGVLVSILYWEHNLPTGANWTCWGILV